MTYSIVARDPETGELGVAVQSHYFTVGPIVPWLQAGVGEVGIVEQVAVAIGVGEARQGVGVGGVDHPPLPVDGLPLAIRHQVERRGVRQVQGRAAVAHSAGWNE